MLEIIDDLAPGAGLLFATAVGSTPDFMTKEGLTSTEIFLAKSLEAH